MAAGGADAGGFRAASVVVSSSQTGPDQTAYDYGSTSDVFVRATFSDGSQDGRTLQLSLAPQGGGTITSYRAQVVSSVATFDLAVAGTLFGKNAQAGSFTLSVSDVATQAPLGQRDVQFTWEGHP